MGWLGYRRVPEPGACAFCLMLATRGAVYSSASTAGGDNRFHAHCRCHPQAETRFDARYDVVISPADANRQIAVWNKPRNQGGRRYTYDLSDYRGRPVGQPPPAPTPAQVMQQLTAKRAQLDGYEKVLAQGRGTPWMEQKAAELRRELGRYDADRVRENQVQGGYPAPVRSKRRYRAVRNPAPLNDVINLNVLPRSPVYQELRQALNAAGSVHGLPRGAAIEVRLKVMPQSLHGLQSGGVVDVDPDGPFPGLTVVHELWHAYEEVLDLGQAKGSLQEVRKTLVGQKSQWKKRAGELSMGEYMNRDSEMLARAYAQWIAMRTNDPILIAQVNGRIRTAGHWTVTEFKPIAQGFETVLRDLHWST